MTIFLWLLLSASLFAVGEYLSKKFALNPTWQMACCIVPMYAMGSIAWLPAIAKGKQLAVYGSMWNILSFLMTLFVGLVIFKEQLTTTQIAGCILAGVAIILLSI